MESISGPKWEPPTVFGALADLVEAFPEFAAPRALIEDFPQTESPHIYLDLIPHG